MELIFWTINEIGDFFSYHFFWFFEFSILKNLRIFKIFEFSICYNFMNSRICRISNIFSRIFDSFSNFRIFFHFSPFSCPHRLLTSSPIHCCYLLLFSSVVAIAIATVHAVELVFGWWYSIFHCWCFLFDHSRQVNIFFLNGFLS